MLLWILSVVLVLPLGQPPIKISSKVQTTPSRQDQRGRPNHCLAIITRSVTQASQKTHFVGLHS